MGYSERSFLFALRWTRSCPLMAEAVEELGCQVAREFARFGFAREEWHQSPSQWLYVPSG